MLNLLCALVVRTNHRVHLSGPSAARSCDVLMYVVFHAADRLKFVGVTGAGIGIGLACELTTEDGTDGFPGTVQERHWEGLS